MRFITCAALMLVTGVGTAACRKVAQANRTGTAQSAVAAPSENVSEALDSVGLAVEDLETRAYDLAAPRFFEDPEDAQASRGNFYQSSVKILGLAVAADSSNAWAQYHLGAVLARKSYSGFGTWDRRLLAEAVEQLRNAEGRATGPYAALRPKIQHDREEQERILATAPGGS